MTPKRGVAFVMLVIAAGAAPAATVIGFDDIAFPGGDPLAAAPVPAGYRGLAWGDAWTVSPNDATGWYGGTLQPYAHSPANFAWNGGGNAYELSVSGGGTFDVVSLWARTWPATPATVTAHGFLNGVEVHTQSFSLTDAYVNVTLDFDHIDEFTTATGQQFLIDDLVVDNVLAVPEPATAALWLAGGLVVAACRRPLPRRR